MHCFYSKKNASSKNKKKDNYNGCPPDVPNATPRRAPNFEYCVIVSCLFSFFKNGLRAGEISIFAFNKYGAAMQFSLFHSIYTGWGETE